MAPTNQFRINFEEFLSFAKGGSSFCSLMIESNLSNF